MLPIEMLMKSVHVLDSDSKYIIIIGPAYPLRGGLATYNQLLASKLQEAGHRVEIQTFRLQYPKILFPGKTQYSSDPKPENLKIVKSINSINPFNWIIQGFKIRVKKPDLVIFRFWMPFMGPSLGTIGRIIKGNGKSRIVAITDNVIPHERRPMDKPFTQYFLKACHGFVAMSKSVQDDLKRWVDNKPSLFNPHPMYESFGLAMSKQRACSELGLDPNFKYLLFFGFIRKYKGLDLLLESFALVNNNKLKLIIAGEYYDDSEPYMRLIEKLALEDRLVQVNRFIPDTKVHLYFCASSLVVQTYKTATQSGVTQIAYYYNRPMVVTHVGGLAELVPHGKVGYVVDTEKESIAKAIERYFNEEKELEFSENIEEEKKRFSWNSMIERLFEAAKI